ncbi:GGDEF domain-containing protein [Alteromonas sp. ASW11-36]|uniref:diguanylate cyclase n=1 Tax=Alteromonas arenosi TaxID=3055817 RepID=A0ABT7SXN3_9ALTE|nr:GGDEF domain-containing protein [Alteromonas sp. ASW11-36]MDM7860951.1 GGDEF domain-containing protein [Alteromonas sp. ASW11-36]
MNRTVVIFPNSNPNITTVTDSVYDGYSEIELEVSADLISFTCDLKNPGYTHPFCAIEIPVNDGKPVDLNTFTHVNITIDRESSVPDTTLIYLINQESDSTVQWGERSNLRTVYVDNEETFSLPIDSFTVPSWWLLLNAKDYYGGASRYDAVTKITVATGDANQDRQEAISISRVVLVGKWINQDSLRLILLSAWAVVCTLHVLLFIKIKIRESQRIRAKADSLSRLNTILNIERDKFETMAKTDSLTNVKNRAGLRDDFNRCIDMYKQSSCPSCAILLDIDHFKQINDTHGHDVGDSVLIEFAERLQDGVRSDDSVGRWGGEEFIIIASGVAIKEATALAEKLRTAIEQQPFGEISITCSFGISELTKEGVTSWIKRADKALYNAKKAGRNRVVADWE